MAGENEQIIGAFKILEDIELEPSTSYKREQLRLASDNGFLAMMLRYAYENSKVYHVKQIPSLNGFPNGNTVENFWKFFRLLDDLADQKFTGNVAMKAIYEVMSLLDKTELKWYSRILKKDLNIGVKETMISQELPGLISVFQVQLAKEFDGHLPQFILAQPKLDGYRCLAHTSTGYLFSRNGKRLEGYTTLEEQVRQLPSGYELDCEIMSEDFKGTQSSAFSHTVGKKGILNAFDLISESKDCDTRSQLERSNELSSMLQEFTLDHIRPVSMKLISGVSQARSLDELYEYYSQCVAEGYEGTMIKDATAPYQRKRTRNWQKLKPVKTIDLKVTYIEEGNIDTKYVGMTGRLVCDFEGNEVRVGSGLSDYQRQLWWNDPTLIVGKTVELIYQEVSNNQAGGKSLRFPRLNKVRTDK